MAVARRSRHLLEEFSVRALVWFVRRLPLESALSLGAALGGLAFSLLRVRREVTLANLARTVGRGWGRRRLARTGRRSYENFGRSLAEFARFPLLTREYVDRCVSLEGLNHLDSALGTGRGVLFITGHFGSWELLGGVLAIRGYRMSYLVGEQHNPGVDRLMNSLRRSLGIGIVRRGMGLRGAVLALRRGEIVALLADQDAGRRGVWVDFLGRPASTPQGAAALALRTGAPLITAYMVRECGPRHRVVVRPAIEARPGGRGYEEDLIHYTQAHTDRLADFVRRHPDHWFWPHRRWKTRPHPGDARR